MVTKSQKLLYYIIAGLGGRIDDKTKLAKLEYFTDFIHYAFNDVSISVSENYTREKQGPLAVGFNADLAALKKQGVLQESPPYHFKILKGIDCSLSELEGKTLNFVLQKYGKLSYSDLVHICHSQAPYLSTKEGQTVPFFTAYNLVDEYPDYAGTIS